MGRGECRPYCQEGMQTMVDEGTTASLEQVAELLQQLKQEISYHRRVLADTSADDKVLGLARLAALDRVHAAARVNSHLPIAWPTWPRGVWPKIEALAQKVVRRLLRWYIDPIVEQQNRFNAAVAQVLDIYWREICSLQAQPPREKDE